MAEDTTKPVVRTGPLAFVRSPEDFWGGLVLVVLAALAWWATITLPGQSGFAFGPGTAPRLFMIMLALNGIAIMAIGIFSDGNDVHYSWKSTLFLTGLVLIFLVACFLTGGLKISLSPFSFSFDGVRALIPMGILVAGSFALIGLLDRLELRGVYFITLAVLTFAACIRPLGLIISAFLLVVVSSAATHEVKWLQTVIWAAVLAGFCAFLFPYVLNLPMQLWPRF